MSKYRVATIISMFAMLLLSGAWPGMSVAQDTVRKFSRTPSFTQGGAESCLSCHSGEKMHAISASPHFDLNVPGTPANNHACESCHGPGSIHVSRAHGGQGFPPLIRFDRRNSQSTREEQLHACLSCHGDENKVQKQIGFMGSAHDRRNINCSTCHSVHTESDPISEKETQDSTCGRCHRKDIREHPRVKKKGIGFDTLNCSACHNVHKPVEEQE